jgi:3-hydroxyisobutyrate dehydrogenase
MLRFGLFVRGFHASCRASDKIGFIGLGNMGAGMAANLLKKGHQVVVYDINQQPVSLLCQSGAISVPSAGDIAEKGVDCIVTMLPNSSNVQDVYEAVLHKAKKGTLLIDSSTIDPLVARQLAQKAKELGLLAVDAPVSGGVPRAVAGTLTFMVGADDDGIKRARPILECMGSSVIHCGGNGSGQVVKLCNNLSLAIQMIGISESMNLGMQLGMDPKKMASIFNTATSRCWSCDSYNPVPGVMENVPASRNYEGGFGVDLMSKDLGLALKAAEMAGVQVPLGTSASDVYKRLQAEGLGRKDFSVTYQWLQSQNKE